MIHRIAAFLLVTLSIALAACGGGAAEPPPATPATPSAPSVAAPVAPAAEAPSAEASAPLKQPGEAAVGDRTTCPVSGEEFTVAASSPHAEYEGKTYYFCCGGCKGKFEADPEKYLKKNGS